MSRASPSPNRPFSPIEDTPVIDYILAFPNQAAAIADPVVGAYFVTPPGQVNGQWRGDVCIPNLAVTVLGTGQPMNITLPSGQIVSEIGPNAPFDAQWRIAIGLPARMSALDTHPNLEIVANRDLANAGAPLATYILSSNVPVANLTQLAVSPSFVGSNYVYGGT